MLREIDKRANNDQINFAISIVHFVHKTLILHYFSALYRQPFRLSEQAPVKKHDVEAPSLGRDICCWVRLSRGWRSSWSISQSSGIARGLLLFLRSSSTSMDTSFSWPTGYIVSAQTTTKTRSLPPPSPHHCLHAPDMLTE
jgi:hypothetical protein